jgi:hypothetical protein
MGREIEAVAVALNGDDDAREGCRVRGNLLEHLPEGLPGGLAEQAEVAAVEFENGAQELGNGEDELGVADLLEDVAVEPLGEKQDAFLLACGTEDFHDARLLAEDAQEHLQRALALGCDPESQY